MKVKAFDAQGKLVRICYISEPTFGKAQNKLANFRNQHFTSHPMGHVEVSPNERRSV